jgi:hypothetical protein
VNAVFFRCTIQPSSRNSAATSASMMSSCG